VLDVFVGLRILEQGGDAEVAVDEVVVGHRHGIGLRPIGIGGPVLVQESLGVVPPASESEIRSVLYPVFQNHQHKLAKILGDIFTPVLRR